MSQVMALSEIQRAIPQATAAATTPPVTTPSPTTPADEGKSIPPLQGPLVGPDGGLPDPSPIIRAQPPKDMHEDSLAPSKSLTSDDTPVKIIKDVTQLPQPVQRMRQLLLDAAASGDIEKLRPLIGRGPNATFLSLVETDADPIDYLRSNSGDAAGQEILAILMDLLNTGAVHLHAGEPDDIYVWPYFVAFSLDELTPPQKVDLLRLVTAGDVEDMKAFGAYNFYRIGISPDGQWRFFLVGD